MRKFRKSKEERDLISYIDYKKEFQKLCRTKKQNFHRNTLKSVAANVKNSKQFWSEVKFSQRTYREIPRIPIDKWHNHFQIVFQSIGLEETDNESDIFNNQETLSESEQALFNGEITDDEILAVVRELKRNKATAGYLVPEHFIVSVDLLLPYIRQIFNRIFLRGIFPDQWSLSLLVPVYKKGPLNNPDNYRGIALLQIHVLSKLYVNILNKRLAFFTNAYDKITEAQG